MKFVNASNIDRKSGVRLGERGAPVLSLWHWFWSWLSGLHLALTVLGGECVGVAVHFSGLRCARQEQNAVSEGYTLILLDGVVQWWRLGVEDVLPKRICGK
jgi:hypothetical protein